jgi:hypothetical protein
VWFIKKVIEFFIIGIGKMEHVFRISVDIWGCLFLFIGWEEKL